MKLIPIFVIIAALCRGQLATDAAPRAAYLVTHATSAEAKALFSAKLVRMNAAKLRWYDDSSVVHIEIPPKSLAELRADPDVEVVISDQEQLTTYGPMPEAKPPESKLMSCAIPAPSSQATGAPLPLPLPAPLLPAVPNLPMPAGGGMPMMPGVGNPMITPAVGLADALAGGVAQKLLNRPPSCKVSILNHTTTYPAKGGEGLIDVKASGSCAWQAQASVGWITILSGSGVSGDGIISYRVTGGEGLARSASIWISAVPGGSPIKGKASQVITQNK